MSVLEVEPSHIRFPGFGSLVRKRSVEISKGLQRRLLPWPWNKTSYLLAVALNEDLLVVNDQLIQYLAEVASQFGSGYFFHFPSIANNLIKSDFTNFPRATQECSQVAVAQTVCSRRAGSTEERDAGLARSFAEFSVAGSQRHELAQGKLKVGGVICGQLVIFSY